MRYRVISLSGCSQALSDVAEMLGLALQEAKLKVELRSLPAHGYKLENGLQDILIGFHAAPEVWDGVPPRTALATLEGFNGTPSPIVYQTECLLRERQTVVSSSWRRQAMRAVIWDCSAMNAMLLRTKHVPLGYVKDFVRPLATDCASPDIDVLLLGTLNDRRANVLGRLKALGLKTQFIIGDAGPLLETTLARSKVVLHAHLQAPGLFESAHVLPLIHRGLCVLDERSCNGEGAGVCSSASYAELPEASLSLVRGNRYIDQRAEDHARLREQVPLSQVLLRALDLVSVERPSGASAQAPRAACHQCRQDDPAAAPIPRSAHLQTQAK